MIKKVLIKLILSLIITAILFVGIEAVLIQLQKRTYKKHAANGLFFWGDSQLFQALSTNMLDNMNVDYFSQCQHGAGYYDLMNFVASVPEGSDCILSYTVGFYRSRGDRNIGGLSPLAVSTLLKARQEMVYEKQLSTRELLLINAQPQSYYFHSNKHIMYDDFPNLAKRTHDSLDIGKMKINRKNIDIKYGIFKKALNILKQKNCRIRIIVFPVNPKLAPGTDFSKAEEFHWESAKKLGTEFNLQPDTLHIDLDPSQAYYDYTHLTGKAAKIFTHAFMDHLAKKNTIAFVDFKLN